MKHKVNREPGSAACLVPFIAGGRRFIASLQFYYKIGILGA